MMNEQIELKQKRGRPKNNNLSIIPRIKPTFRLSPELLSGIYRLGVTCNMSSRDIVEQLLQRTLTGDIQLWKKK